MSWPKTAVIANSPASSAYGPASRDHADERVGDLVGGARLGHRRRERDHPGDQHDRRPVDGPVGAVDRHDAEQHHRARGEQAGDDRGHDPGREHDDHRDEHDDRPPWRPSPSGTTWRRTCSGESTTRTLRSSRLLVERRPRPLAAAGRRRRRASSRRARGPRPCAGRPGSRRSPLSVTIPGKTVSPTNSERGGITTSATPLVRLMSARASSSRYCSTRIRACSAEVGRQAARLARRQQPLAEQQHDHDRPDDQRDADERELEEAEGAAAVGRGGLVDDHVHRRPGERQHRPGVRPEAPAASAAARASGRAGRRSRRSPAAARRPRR